jgi:hypothetical protein
MDIIYYIFYIWVNNLDHKYNDYLKFDNLIIINFNFIFHITLIIYNYSDKVINPLYKSGI